MRQLPTIAEIAERLAIDPPVEPTNVSLVAELRARGEHEAAATIETQGRLLFEVEKAVLVANVGLRWIVDWGDGLESPAAASNTLSERPV